MSAAGAEGPLAPAPRERRWVALLLALHATLAIWGAARNSVTFDENFHLPAGIAYIARGYTAASVAQPPLVKALAALPALAAGARIPPDSSLMVPDETRVGEAFMRLNADRYHRVYFAARLVVVTCSVLLGLLIWKFARELHGPRGALLALGVYALLPESLAHAGVVGMDLPTALGFLATVYAFLGFARTGRWRAWAWLALAVGATALVRFSAVQLGPILLILAAVGVATGEIRRRRRVAIGLALLPLAAFVLLHLGYLGQTTLEPLSRYFFHSAGFRALQDAHPGWRLPLPDAYLGGLDYLLSLAQSGKMSYLLGQVRDSHAVHYFPFAMLVKWPLGFLGLLVAGAVVALRRRGGGRTLWRECVLLGPVVVVLGSAMTANLDFGIRYIFPAVPFLCVWLGALMAADPGQASAARHPAPRGTPRPRRRATVWASLALVAVLAVETALCAPWYLSFFNAAAGGPGRGDRLLNDSNVDWGQGLLALRDEMARRGIERVHLAYHGTTDPATYGIDYIPYRGGTPGTEESEWLAVSSYFLVGLPAPMMTGEGRSESTRMDFHRLWDQMPVARPAGCMYLFRMWHRRKV